MIEVSQKWIENQKQYLTSEGFIRVYFKVSDPEATADAILTSDNETWFSNVQETINGEDKNITPYATLEVNQFILDGSKELLPDENQTLDDTSYISDILSNDSSIFDTNPVIDIAFSEVHKVTIPAVSITFDTIGGEFARDFTIRTYRQGTLINTIQIIDNESVNVIVYADIENYDEIQIEISRWCLPNHRARITEIFLGIIKEFDKSHLMSYNHSQEVDPIGATTPKVEVEFSIDNTDNVFDPDNEEGLYQYLARKQEIIVKYGFKIDDSIEYIEAGKFYLSEWETSENDLEVTFTARDLLEFMSANYIYGLYSPDTPTTLYDLAEDVLNKANLPTNEDGTKKWVLSDTLKEFSTTAPLPVCTQAECLQYIAQACCCVLFYDRTGTLHIEPINEDISDYSIDRDNSYTYPEISLQKILKEVNVKVYHYYLAEEEEEVFNGTISVTGTQKIIISYTKSCEVSGITITNGTLVSSQYFTDTCILEIEANGNVDVVISGYELKNSQSDYVLTNDDEGEEQEVDNPLITSTAWAEQVANWVKSWLVNRKIIETDFRIDPRLDVLDIVQVTNKFATHTVRTTAVELEYTGAFKGKTTGRII